MKFNTVKVFCESTIKEKSSIFIGKVYPVETEGEVYEILEKSKKEYYDAAHICFAYKIFPENIKYSDAGEPSGTAGIRILNAINHFELQNVLAVVIRYFGGTKLGVGLLGKTYYNSAFNVLEKCEIVIKTGYKKILIESDANNINNIYHLIDKHNGKTNGTDYADNFKIECSILNEELEKFTDNLLEISRGKVHIKVDEGIVFK